VPAAKTKLKFETINLNLKSGENWAYFHTEYWSRKKSVQKPINYPIIGICSLSKKNDVISSVRKHYYALRLGLELGLGLAEMRFRSNVFSCKFSTSHNNTYYEVFNHEHKAFCKQTN